MNRKLIALVSLTLALTMVLTACATGATPTPQVITVKETVVQKETVVVPGPTAAPQATAAPGPTTFPRNETLYISGAAWGPASTWNPWQPGNLANTTGTIGLLYETLFAFDPLSGKMTGFLADSGNWTNPTTFDVVLRKGLTWSDGKPLTSADVKYTMELQKQYKALPFNKMWDYLTSVDAADDTHLTFKFTAPLYQEFENNLYNIPIVPKHLWETRSEQDITVGANAKPVGSGAYLYIGTGEDRNMWQRNDKWWGLSIFGTPAPKYIVDIRTSSNNVAMGMVLKGELDLSNNFLPGVAELINKGYVKSYYAGAPYMLSANTAILFLNTKKKPLDDVNFRKALAYAIDVPSIVKVAYADLVKPASPTGLLPSLDQFVDKGVVDKLGWKFDAAKAKQILADAGYKDTNGDKFVEAPDGSKIALQVTCPNGWTDWMAAIDVIAKSAQAAGINIQTALPDQSAWIAAFQSGSFDTTLQNNTNLSNTPWTVYNTLFNHPIKEQMLNGNFGRYENKAVFDAVDALAKVPFSDTAGMKAACSKIQESMLADVPMIPLWYNGMWGQWSNASWTNWPDEKSSKPTLPCTWNGYWQLGGLQTLINLKPVTK